MRFPAVGENGNRRQLSGSVAEVHKPLGIGADIGQNHDTLWDIVVPSCRVLGPSRWMCQAFMIPSGEHGMSELLHVYREGRLYKF